MNARFRRGWEAATGSSGTTDNGQADSRERAVGTMKGSPICKCKYTFTIMSSTIAFGRRTGRPSMASTSLAPQQARSRESLRKLLKAAAAVLAHHGVDGATIPRIAAHAGLTPGAVYRRFKDKDALFESVILGILERQQEQLLGTTADAARPIPLAVFADQ